MVRGMFASGETPIKSIVKRLSGNRSSNRHFYAEALAVHLISHHCELAENIVTELYSPAEMESIKLMNSDTAGPLLFAKMASH